jgi:phosphoribosyl 1,2-cyclic phosphodiesterase
MALSFCSFSSGSGGNSYLVRTTTTALLVDAGISAKKIIAGLEQTGTEDHELRALLITHEHSDHIKSLCTLMKKKQSIEAYANQGTWDAMRLVPAGDRNRTVVVGEPFMIGDITVKAFSVCHDAADPVGYSFYAEGRQMSIVTDTGCIPEGMVEEVTGADLLVLEANHDVDMLRIGRYPWFLKQRILGDHGHLSNETAARMLVRLLAHSPKNRKILLAHLSRENNFPEMAYQTVKNILEEEAYLIGDRIEVATIVRDEVSAVFQV